MLRVGTSKEKGKKSSLKRIPKQTQGSPVRGHFRVEAEGPEGAWRLVCLGCPNATLHRIGLDVFCLRGPSKTSQAPWLLRHQASDLGLHPEVLATRIGPCGQGRGHTQGLGGESLPHLCCKVTSPSQNQLRVGSHGSEELGPGLPSSARWGSGLHRVETSLGAWLGRRRRWKVCELSRDAS